MKKLRMKSKSELTFETVCERYLECCRQRNLRQGTIEHYRQSFIYFCYSMLYHYNKSRGVQTTGIHRYRHTFAKQWILSGGNVVSLSRLLGHSSLDITQNYINLLVSDIGKQVDEINVLDKFSSRTKLTMGKKSTK